MQIVVPADALAGACPYRRTQPREGSTAMKVRKDRHAEPKAEQTRLREASVDGTQHGSPPARR
jgi:hypothetical protein